MKLKFLVDESAGKILAEFLKSLGYDCVCAIDELKGKKDDEVLNIAYRQRRILITNDKDFGFLIIRKKKKHKGVILLRLKKDSPLNRIKIIKDLINTFGEKLKGKFVIASEKGVRIRKI